MADPSPQHDGRRGAMVKTTIIVLVVVGAAFALAWLLTQRLIESWAR